ncbi:MAG TPA: (d)CMP kinase, partial [Candidatus Acidoferrum sp.]|nr:(d)CMP kinase [Candidatus Acidoferrum sp.]
MTSKPCMGGSGIPVAKRKRLVIAIDGPVGAGKSTAARRLAEILGYLYIDSGAMYRALGWKAVRTGTDLHDRQRVEALALATNICVILGTPSARVLVDDRDVTAELRTPAMDEASSVVSTYPEVRRRLVTLQRAMAESGGVVMDGRDIGTVVFPNADLKFYLDADLSVRASRRLRDLQRGGGQVDLETVRVEVARRDARDCGRETSPLTVAVDAIRMDSTSLDVEAVVQ